jgi:hypothetical protein
VYRESSGRLSYRSFRSGLVTQLQEWLLTGFEWEWIEELYCDSPQAVGELVNAADGASADEFVNIEFFIGIIKWDAKTRSYVLAYAGAAPVRITGEGRPSAANVHHLTL